jgi:hypothetical protein
MENLLKVPSYPRYRNYLSQGFPQVNSVHSTKVEEILFFLPFFLD